jgi:hypothetical protein
MKTFRLQCTSPFFTNRHIEAKDIDDAIEKFFNSVGVLPQFKIEGGKIYALTN